MNKDEIQPESKPNAIGIAKVRRLVRPNNSATTIIVRTAKEVVTVVKIFLTITLLRLRLTSSPNGLSL